MEQFNRKKHWENIYQTKQIDEVSWFQASPTTSLQIISDLDLPLNAKIIDVGGGDSLLVDHLLLLGYDDITVLDVSATALERAKNRLGAKAALVKWIVADAASFQPTETYDFWHDRAAFHFLSDQDEIKRYVATAHKCISPKGALVIACFSDVGPKKCSGIDVVQYSESALQDILKPYFDITSSITIDHVTPFDTSQNFLFCSFRKM
jgi:SAM-dependent methyltransferase